jgi:hypothetical protein
VYQSGVSRTPHPSEPPEAALGRQALEERVDGRLELLVEQVDGRVDLGHRPPDLRAKVPPVGKAHRPAAHHEATAAFDHQHEVLRNEAGRRVERVQVGIELRVGPIGAVLAQVLDQRVSDLLCLVGDAVVEHGEDRVGVCRHQAGLGRQRRGGVGTELDPVAQVERAHSETPAERRGTRRRRTVHERQVRHLGNSRPGNWQVR